MRNYRKCIHNRRKPDTMPLRCFQIIPAGDAEATTLFVGDVVPDFNRGVPFLTTIHVDRDSVSSSCFRSLPLAFQFYKVWTHSIITARPFYHFTFHTSILIAVPRPNGCFPDIHGRKPSPLRNIRLVKQNPIRYNKQNGLCPSLTLIGIICMLLAVSCLDSRYEMEMRIL